MTWNRAAICAEKIVRAPAGADLAAAWVEAREDLIRTLGALFDVPNRSPASTVFTDPKSYPARLLAALAEAHLREGAAAVAGQRRIAATKGGDRAWAPKWPMRDASDAVLEDVFVAAVRADAPGAKVLGFTCERELVARVDGGRGEFELAVVPFLKATLEATLAKVLPRAVAPVSDIPPALAAAMRGDGQFFTVPQPLPNGLVEMPPVDEISANG